ncbi:MAG: thioredoxin family protein [bacterium]|nr:thioredoxin family protein [bacterium]
MAESTSIKVFGKPNCAKCKTTKNKLEFFIPKWNMSNRVKMSFYDMDTVEGLAEGAFYNVDSIPTTVVENDGKEIKRWELEVPPSKEVEVLVKGGIR